jgi:serine/threonine-protein kinase RsbW
VQVSVRLELPRDEMTIPVIRRLCGQSLRVVGVRRAVIEDVELALTEACANVLRHAEVGSNYEVTVGFDEERAFIEVADRGPGFDPQAVNEPAPEDESGRGLQLMKELMDSVRFDSATDSGTTVRLEKRLEWLPGAPMERLAGPVS